MKPLTHRILSSSTWDPTNLMHLGPFHKPSVRRYQRTSQHFLEPKRPIIMFTGALHSSQYHPVLSLQQPSEYYALTYGLVILVISFLLTFPQYLYAFLLCSIRATCPASLSRSYGARSSLFCITFTTRSHVSIGCLPVLPVHVSATVT